MFKQQDLVKLMIWTWILVHLRMASNSYAHRYFTLTMEANTMHPDQTAPKGAVW